MLSLLLCLLLVANVNWTQSETRVQWSNWSSPQSQLPRHSIGWRMGNIGSGRTNVKWPFHRASLPWSYAPVSLHYLLLHTCFPCTPVFLPKPLLPPLHPCLLLYLLHALLCARALLAPFLHLASVTCGLGSVSVEILVLPTSVSRGNTLWAALSKMPIPGHLIIWFSEFPCEHYLPCHTIGRLFISCKVFHSIRVLKLFPFNIHPPGKLSRSYGHGSADFLWHFFLNCIYFIMPWNKIINISFCKHTIE
jgi:hypothetical protein